MQENDKKQETGRLAHNPHHTTTMLGCSGTRALSLAACLGESSVGQPTALLPAVRARYVTAQSLYLESARNHSVARPTTRGCQRSRRYCQRQRDAPWPKGAIRGGTLYPWPHVLPDGIVYRCTFRRPGCGGMRVFLPLILLHPCFPCFPCISLLTHASQSSVYVSSIRSK